MKRKSLHVHMDRVHTLHDINQKKKKKELLHKIPNLNIKNISRKNKRKKTIKWDDVTCEFTLVRNYRSLSR